MRIVVSIGGSVLAPDRSVERVGAHADVIDGLVAEGHDVAAVVGGGSVARRYIETARQLGATEYDLDAVGIDATRLNARLLATALDAPADTDPVESHEAARAAVRRGETAVMGGTVPGHTTDAVSALLAETLSADLLVYATSVDGVYSTDPDEDDAAVRHDHLTPGELVDVIASIETAAGSQAPVDLLAAKVIERSGLRAVVLDGTDPSRVTDAVAGDVDGTDVVPDD